MFDIVYKYLILNKQLSIPGVGQFFIVQVPARLDFKSKVIHPPSTVIKFSNAATTADKSFYDFASQELHVEQLETVKQFQEFSYKLKNDVHAYNSIELPGLGLLVKNSLGDLVFKPDIDFNDYFPTVSVAKNQLDGMTFNKFNNTSEPTDEPLIEDDYEALEKKDRWMVAAFVLGVAGIAAIVIYYYLRAPD